MPRIFLEATVFLLIVADEGAKNKAVKKPPKCGYTLEGQMPRLDFLISVSTMELRKIQKDFVNG